MTDHNAPDSGSTASSSTSGSTSSGSGANTLVSSKAAAATQSVGADDARATFRQLCREIEEREAKDALGSAPAADTPDDLVGKSSSSLEDGGPKAPDFGDMFKHFEEMEREGKQQVRTVEERDERESEAAKAGARAEMALAAAIAGGMARGAATMAVLRGNAAVEAGYRLLEGQTNSGAAQHDRTEDAGWREYHQTEQRGLGQLDRSQTAGDRQHETEERRRSNGMSL